MALTTYPTPNITNYTGIFDYANDVTSNYFGASIPWIVFIVGFTILATRNYSSTKSAMTAGFISWIIAIMMSMFNWVEEYVVIIFGVIVIVTTAISIKEKTPWG